MRKAPGSKGALRGRAGVGEAETRAGPDREQNPDGTPRRGRTAAPHPPASPLFPPALYPRLLYQPREPALPKHIVRAARVALMYSVAKGTQERRDARGVAPRAPAQLDGSSARLRS